MLNHRKLRLRALSAAMILAATVGVVRSQGQVAAPPNRASARAWVTAWSTSQQALGSATVSNATVRMIARVTIPGTAVRIRLDNAYGTTPVHVGHAAVGHRIQGAQVAAGSSRPVTFNGAADVTIPARASAWSDAVDLPVAAHQDLAVSLHVAGDAVPPSQHTNAVVTSYRTADNAGDLTLAEERAAFSTPVTSTWWLKAIDVEASASTRAVVMFGDSITDGTCSTLDAHDRWHDLVSLRLALAADADAAARRTPLLRAVINEGIGGNTVTRDGLTPSPDSSTGLERFERDVLGHHGVATVVVFMGTNDIRRGARAAQVIDGLAQISRRLEAAGLKSVGVTIIPRHNVSPTPGNSGWNDEKTRTRREVNQWIRSRGAFDRVIDFDQTMRVPAQPDLMQPAFNCGDGIHPSPAGYFAMGRSVDLLTFRTP